MKKYVMALDQGTTSSRTIIFDRQGRIVSMAQKEFTQIFPRPAWVEHDPEEIYRTQFSTLQEALDQSGIGAEEIDSIGITNQRETTVIWDKRTGKPVYNAICWQCRRTMPQCESIKNSKLGRYMRSATGLMMDAYFSVTKICWILDNVQGVRERAEKGELLFGTMDSWLIWNLTQGKVHATDVSNASRTMLYHITEMQWDERILKELNIPKSLLPRVNNSSDEFGFAMIRGVKIPICGVAGDQQAALFGQACFEEGMGKNTYGTGCFMLVNTGGKAVFSQSGLLTTIGWSIKGETVYALEGSIFIAGAVVAWLRDQLQIIQTSAMSEEIAQRVVDNGGVYFVPAFVGLGAPHWDMQAQGMITGLSRGSGKDYIVRAALESIAYQLNDVLEMIEEETQGKIEVLKVDGGASLNNFLMQFQADISKVKVERPVIFEATAIGVAYFAGLYTGFWKSKEEILKIKKVDRSFAPAMREDVREKNIAGWKKAVRQCLQK